MEIKRLVVIVTLAVLFTLGGEASAQGVGVGASIDVEIIPPSPFAVAGPREGKEKEAKVYVVKMLCGTIDPTSEATPQLVPGTYHTAINVVNLSNSTTEVLRVFPPSTIGFTDFLDGLGVRKFDCTDFSEPGFFEKILLLAVSPKDNLGVTAVYTLKSVEQAP